MLLQIVVARLTFDPPGHKFKLGALDACALIDAGCPNIGAQDCCGEQLVECVDDGSGTGTGIAKLKNCNQAKTCIRNDNGGGGCETPRKTV